MRVTERLLLLGSVGLFLSCMGVFFFLPSVEAKSILAALIPVTAAFIMVAGVIFGRNVITRWNRSSNKEDQH